MPLGIVAPPEGCTNLARFRMRRYQQPSHSRMVIEGLTFFDQGLHRSAALIGIFLPVLGGPGLITEFRQDTRQSINGGNISPICNDCIGQ